ncbi:hypothetical protein [Helicobacter pylori]|nr:hypothetical protein [Helicobacter pylori]
MKIFFFFFFDFADFAQSLVKKIPIFDTQRAYMRSQNAQDIL